MSTDPDPFEQGRGGCLVKQVTAFVYAVQVNPDHRGALGSKYGRAAFADAVGRALVDGVAGLALGEHLLAVGGVGGVGGTGRGDETEGGEEDEHGCDHEVCGQGRGRGGGRVPGARRVRRPDQHTLGHSGTE